MGNKIEVSIAQGLDVPNFIKDVPNGLRFVPNGGMTSNHFLRLSKGINGPW